MKKQTWARFERRVRDAAAAAMESPDPAHDLSHVHRVVRNAEEISRLEGGKPEIVLPAAWLHDLVVVPKSSPDRAKASRLAAAAAATLLREIAYPSELLEPIAHAIAAHSFSAGIEPETLEARIVQDSDRLDALGAIGIARCFATGGAMGRPLYCEADPFAQARAPDDSQWTLDHFPRKLLRLAESMRTAAGARLARERSDFIRLFLDRMRQELPQPGRTAVPDEDFHEAKST